jgi:hypothetical protein
VVPERVRLAVVLSDDDSCVTPLGKKGDIPVFDQKPDDLVVKGPRKRKTAVAFDPIVKLPTPVKKQSTVIRGEAREIGGPKPILLDHGESWPLFAERQTSMPTSISAFADGNLKYPDTRPAPSYRTERRGRNGCIEWVNNNMQRLSDSDMAHARIMRFKQTANQEAYHAWWKASGSLVTNEVELALFTNEIRLKFTQLPGRIPSEKGDVLRGQYEAMVTLSNGKVRTFQVANDWVESNFTKECLAVVQKIALDTKEVYKDKKSSKSHYGFISMDNPNQTAELDNRQVSKIRYLPGKFLRRPNGKMEWNEPIWKGLINMGDNSGTEIVTLPNEWISSNISQRFQDLLIGLRDKGAAGFVLIPEGANEAHEEGVVSFLENAPWAKSWNKDQSHDSRRCVLDSAASGMWYLGYGNLSWLLMSGNDKKDVDAMGYFGEVVEQKSNKEQRRKFQVIRLSSARLKKWDTIRDAGQYHLCLLGVASNDGKTDHAICIVGGWIFDSNFERALPFNAESLDICCSSNERHTEYMGVTRGYVLQNR